MADPIESEVDISFSDSGGSPKSLGTSWTLGSFVKTSLTVSTVV